MRILVPLDLTKNEIRNGVIQNLATAPGSPVTGQFYCDTASTPTLKMWNGTAWVSFGTGSGTVVSVAAGDGTITVAGTAASPTIAVATGGITNSQVSASAAIAYSKLALGNSVVNADIATTAAIAYSKLALTGSVVNADVATNAGIVYAKLSLGNSITNADIANGAAITYPKLNLAGSVKDNDIAGNAAIGFSKLASPTAAFDFGGQKLQNLATPVAGTDAANKSYVDGLVQGLSPKQAVQAASTANVNVASAPASLDGYTLQANDRVLLKDQTLPKENGIYVFAAAGSALTRAADMAAWTQVPSAYCWVELGTANADTAWVCTSDPGGSLGTTSIVFAKFTGASELGATAPLTIVSNSLTLSYAGRLVNNGGSLDLASGVVTAGTYTAVTVDTYGRVTGGADLLAGNGLAARTAAGTYAARTITGTANQITVTNGDGVSGNPTVALAAGARSQIGGAGVYSVVGSGTAATFVIAQSTHGLGSAGNGYCDVEAVCWDLSGSSPATRCYPDVSVDTGTGAVTFTFAVNQALSNYRFTIIGK